MNSIDRRRLLQFLALGTLARPANAFWFFGDKKKKQRSTSQIHKLTGKVTINGVAAIESSPIVPGDTIVTGEESSLVFHQGMDAYLLRSNTAMKLESRENSLFADTQRILSGAVLSVYGTGRKEIFSPTATIVLRGTGTYMEVEDNETYLCTCYGRVEFTAKDDPNVTETLKTTHHESPRYIRRNSEGSYMLKAAPINHTDAELIMLEETVGRKPPFVGEEYDPDADYGI